MSCSNCNSSQKIKSGCKNSGSCSRCSSKFSVFDWLSNISPPNESTKCAIIEVSFKNGRKDYFSNEQKHNLKIGDPVMVKCDLGYDIGLVSLSGELVKLQLKRKNIAVDNLKVVLNIPSQIELDKWHKAIGKEKETMLKSRQIVKNLGLKMKITDVEIQADGKRAIFYYLADKRVDFRELIKLLSLRFHTKTLMKQIGARQESGIIGGLGSCGRELCCATWLHDIRSVNITAARYQNLSLNPQKLAGQCGKLKCCLNYELENYMDALKDFPKTKRLIKTKKGEALVQKIDIFKKIIWYSYKTSTHDWMEVNLQNAKKMIALNKQGNYKFIIEDFIKSGK